MLAGCGRERLSYELCVLQILIFLKGLLVNLAFGRPRWLVSSACYIVAFRPFRPAG